MAGTGPGRSTKDIPSGRPQHEERQHGLTSVGDTDASIAELQELYANLREHSQKYQGAGQGLVPPSAPGLLSPRSAAGHGGSDENSVGESLEEGTEDKKKKLSKDQVKELEALFQSGYTGAPEGRAAIGKKMGITERQVAIWFQNRRARQRSKQLSQDFEMLKKDFRMVFLENQVMRKELAELRAQVQSSAERDPSSLTQSQLPLEATHATLPTFSEFGLPNFAKPPSLERPRHPSHGPPERATADDVEFLPRLKRARLYQSEGGPFPGGDDGQPSAGLLPGGGEPGVLSGQPSSGLLEEVVAQGNLPVPGSGGLGLLEGEVRQDLDAALLGVPHERSGQDFRRFDLDLQGPDPGWVPQRDYFDALANTEQEDLLGEKPNDPQRPDRDKDGW